MASRRSAVSVCAKGILPVLLAALMLSRPAAAHERPAPSDDYMQLVQAASERVQERRADEAVQKADAAIRLDATRWEAYAIKGSALLLVSRVDDALALFARAAEYAPPASKPTIARMIETAKAARPKSTATAGTATADAPGAPAAAATDGEHPDADLYAQRVRAVEELVSQKRFADVLTAAREAMQADPDRFEAHYYAAVALFNQDALPDALGEANAALARVPPAGRARVDGLVKAVSEKQASAAALREADQMLADGLLAKATERYSQVWERFPTREDVGLKAAVLWVERLDYPERGARILNAMAKHPRDPEMGAAAEKMLRAVQPTLDKLFETRMAAGAAARQHGDLDVALKEFGDAADALPGRQEPHVERAKIFARRRDLGQTKAAFVAMIRTGAVPTSLLEEDDFGSFVDYAPFVGFLRDALGPRAEAAAREVAFKRSQAWKTQQVRDGMARRERAIGDATAAFGQLVANSAAFQFEHGDYRSRFVAQRVAFGSNSCTAAIAVELTGAHRKTGQSAPLVRSSVDAIDFAALKAEAIAAQDVSGKLPETSPFYGFPAGTYVTLGVDSASRFVDADRLDVSAKHVGPKTGPVWLYFPTRQAADAAVRAAAQAIEACAYPIAPARAYGVAAAVFSSPADSAAEPAMSDRGYSTRLYRPQIGRLFAELTLVRPDPTAAAAFPLTAIVTDAQGREVARVQSQGYAAANVASSVHTVALDGAQPAWPAGSYTVTFESDGRPVSTVAFQLLDQ